MAISNGYNGLKGRVAIITGAGQGIGRRYAQRFAEQGAIPVIAEFNAEAGRSVEAELKAAGHEALFVETDVASEESANAMAQAVREAYGRIDILINNAAVFSKITMAPFWELPPDEWERAMRVNISGPFYCARAVRETMQAAHWGRIINVSSATVIMGRQNYLHYITSKSAVIGMTRSMARELGPWDITVNTFWPGVTQTEVERPSVPKEQFEQLKQMQSLKRLTDMDDLAGAVMFLCSDDAAFITGQSLQVDGGLTFI